MQINVIGFDIARPVFQVHAADNGGQAVAQIRLRRAQVLDYFRSLPPCLVGMEACATAHHWARELMALGHDVRLMPPGYVKAYVKRNKTDAADAEAIAEAVTRPTMRFVPVKSAESQAMLMLHERASCSCGSARCSRMRYGRTWLSSGSSRLRAFTASRSSQRRFTIRRFHPLRGTL